MKVYAATIWLGAFLLFLVQPILARYLVPWYGGSASVWTTCVLFFQTFLLVGYLYAHVVGARLSARGQGLTHLGLLGASLFFLPVTPSGSWLLVSPQAPVGEILTLLTLTIGAPFFMVATTAPLLQHWLARAHPGRSPYRLYAVSNLGALLGLVSYPFLIEPALTLDTQAILWSIGYGIYVGLCGLCAIELVRKKDKDSSRSGRPLEAGAATPRINKATWIFLAGCGSTAFLATTNQLCLNVAVVPFLLILPLSLYLLSFVVCFYKENWYDRRVWAAAFLVGLGLIVVLLEGSIAVGLPAQILIYSFALFACCMVCHGELVRLKPAAAGLTTFYVLISVGGAAGGGFVSIIAPRLFKDFWEFPLVLFIVYLLVGFLVFRDTMTRYTARVGRIGLIAWLGLAWILAFMALTYIYKGQKDTLAMTRNFYGVLRVYESQKGTEHWRRYLWHGPICHGSQIMHESGRRSPTLYYMPDAGISIAVERHPKRRLSAGGTSMESGGLRIGVIGLGTGTLAAYGKPSDVFRFYEINPRVIEFARDYFTYLEDSAATIETVAGDGRVALERELQEKGSQQFDVLAVDAFSGDAIPVHLLTREAFELYLEHLRPGGILAVHVSNLYFNLRPVVRGLAEAFHLPAVLILSPGKLEGEIYPSDWVLITENGRFLGDDVVSTAITPWLTGGESNIIWTDDFSNLFGVLK
jgi:hypothetical protein